MPSVVMNPASTSEEMGFQATSRFRRKPVHATKDRPGGGGAQFAAGEDAANFWPQRQTRRSGSTLAGPAGPLDTQSECQA